MTRLLIETRIVGAHFELLAFGDIDLASADQFRDVAMQALSEAGAGGLVVDFAGVDFIDSSGLGALIQLHHAAAKSDKELALRNTSAGLDKLLAITGLDVVFTTLAPPVREASG
jgi:anti-sigma B factor antagonist